MTGRIPPVGPSTPVPGPVPDRREGRRREDERRKADRRAEGRALVPTDSDDRSDASDAPDKTADAAAKPAATPPPQAGGTGAFEAQMIGQTGGRKGLRGGPPTLNAARSAYLGNEYSGDRDRRPEPGKSGKTEV